MIAQVECPAVYQSSARVPEDVRALFSGGHTPNDDPNATFALRVRVDDDDAKLQLADPVEEEILGQLQAWLPCHHFTVVYGGTRTESATTVQTGSARSRNRTSAGQQGRCDADFRVFTGD